LRQFASALSDCDESLRLQPDNPEFLDSRGFAYLKYGFPDNAISDYNAALRRVPGKAQSLYGRGQAKLQKNDRQGADDDIAAAKSINPRIADEFDRHEASAGRLRPTGQASAAIPLPATATQPRTTPATSAMTVKQLFERYDLMGTFAADCSMPVSEQNEYTVHRANNDYVQRDSMIGPSRRSDASLIDAASEAAPDELHVSMANERRRVDDSIRIARRQWRVFESVTENGQKLISRGRFTQGARSESLWLQKCD